MEESTPRHLAIVGREKEFAVLKEFLSNASQSRGNTILVSGEPGIGKTRLIDEFRSFSEKERVKVLAGAASSDSFRPFLVFSDALAGEVDSALFSEEEYASFSQIFVINRAGMLLAKASPESEDMDADIFASMLSAVQDFVRDSFDQSGEKKAGLGRLEYGDMKILIEHGQHIFLTAVLRSQEHPDMKILLKRAVSEIEESSAGVLKKWSGIMSELVPIEVVADSLAEAKFLVKKDIEGVKLETERLKISDKMLGMLVDISKKRPLLLVLEDLHWADRASLFVLAYLSRNIRESNILILGTARPGESMHLLKTLEIMKSDNSFVEIQLQKLDKAGITALIDSHYKPNDFSEAFKEQMFGTCAGNPFFIIELLKQMFAEGHIRELNGKYTLEREEYTVPSTIEEVVQKRLDALEPEAMALAEFASCAGRVFELGALKLFSSIPDQNTAFEKLSTASIIERSNGNAEFCHALFQDTIYKGISPRWKAMHHKSLGEYYETFYQGKLDEVLYELARNFGLSNEHQKGFDYCLKAGGKAENSYAFEQAAYYISMALSALSHIRGERSVKRQELLEKLGDLWVAAGIYEKALENYAGALAEQKDNVAKARLHRKRGGVFERKSDFGDAFAEVVAGESLIGGDELEHWRLVHQRAGIHLRKGEHDKVIAICEAIIPELGRFQGCERDEGRVLSLLGFAYVRNGLQGKAIECFDRSLALLEKARDMLGRANVYNNLGILYYNQGDYDRARSAYNDGLRIYEELRDQSGIALLYNNIAVTYSTSGQWDLGLELNEKSLRIREKIGDKTGIAMSLVNLGEANFEMGDLDKALDFFKRNLAIVEQTEDRRGTALVCSNIGMVMREKGDLSSAEKWCLRSVEIGRKYNVKDYLVEGLFGLAETYIAAGRFSDAQALGDETMAAMKEAGVKLYQEIHKRVLGMLQAGLGEYGLAERHFSEASAALTEMKAETDMLKINYEWGRVLLARGEKEHTQRGKKMLERTRGSFSSRGMRHWAEKCELAIKKSKEI